MTENRNLSIIALDRAQRRWKVAAILTFCLLVVGSVVGTRSILTLKSQLEKERRSAISARKEAETAQKAAEAGRLRLADATRKVSLPKPVREEVVFLTDQQMYRLKEEVEVNFPAFSGGDPIPIDQDLIPIDQMYRRFPDVSPLRNNAPWQRR